MKVLLVDDHVLFREGVALLLQPLMQNLEVLEAGSCEEALAALQANEGVDLVLMDLGLPGMSGIDGIALIRSRHPAIPVVALSSSDDRPTVLQALDAGAMGFIPKSSSSSVFRGALQLIMAKGIYLPPTVFLGTRMAADPPQGLPGAPAPVLAQSKLPSELGLTERQADVLYLILQGMGAKLICRALNLAPGTVKAHTSAVLRALNVTTRTQAVVVASRLGLRFDRKPKP